jgi:hypothetical protein
MVTLSFVSDITEPKIVLVTSSLWRGSTEQMIRLDATNGQQTVPVAGTGGCVQGIPNAFGVTILILATIRWTRTPPFRRLLSCLRRFFAVAAIPTRLGGTEASGPPQEEAAPLGYHNVELLPRPW